MAGEQIRLADLLAALSVATDLGMAQEPEKAIRACLIATALARRLDLPETQVSDVYYTALLEHLGCSATAHEETHLFGGDELASRPLAERTDVGDPRQAIALLLQAGKGTGLARVRYLARTVRAGKSLDQTIGGAICEVGSRLAERLGLGQGVREGIFQVFERWDGGGMPQRISGDDIVLQARLAVVGHQAVVFERLAGADSAVSVVRERGGGWFDPAIADAFGRFGADILAEIESRDVWEAVLDAEPSPARTIDSAGVDGLARAFADMVDLKSPYMLAHSREVAALVERAARVMGLGDDGATRLRRAALLHDLGRISVPNRIWEKSGRLGTTEWERVRLHAYQTERILTRSRILEPLARAAGMHHERLDGSGYHRGASAGEADAAARVLAAADAFQAMTQERPHRAALAPETAAKTLAEEARAGRFDVECARAVVEAAGEAAPKIRTSWPAGLSEREVDVLRLVARGLSNREIAAELFISSRTAEHHVQHIYTKIGASTRAAAALFAMEHGLVR